MDRIVYYFGMLFTTDIWEETSDFIENAIRALAVDLSVLGITEGGVMSQRGAGANLSVDITKTVARDFEGKRIDTKTNVNLPVDTDTDAVLTEPSGAGLEKWLGIFVKFKRDQQNQVVDGNGQLVYTRLFESSEFKIVQGTEATTGNAVKPTSPGTEYIRIGDVLRKFAQSQIFNADIDQALKDTRTIGNASEIAYDDQFALFTGGEDTAEEALDTIRTEQVADQASITTLTTTQTELKNRYYTVGATDIRLFLDKDNDLLYSMKDTLYKPQNPYLAWNGTVFCEVFESHEDIGEHCVVARIFDPAGGGTYGEERVVATGLVDTPKVVWNGTFFVITWLHQATRDDDFEIRLRLLSTGNNFVEPVETLINNPAVQGIEDDASFRYSITWNSVDDKVGIAWKASDSKIYFRSVEIVTVGPTTTITKGVTIIRIDDGASTTFLYQDASIAYGNSFFAISYVSSANNIVCVRGVDGATEVLTPTIPGETSIAISAGYVAGSNHCVFADNGNNNFTFTILDSDNDVRFMRSNSGGTPFSSIVQVGTFDGAGGGGGGATVQKVHSSTWHSQTQNVVVFYAHEGSTRKISYIEVTDLSVAAGAVANIAGTDDVYWLTDGTVSNIETEDAGSDNYRFVMSDKVVKFPFDIREMKLVLVQDQQSGDITSTIAEYKQGHGGNLTYLIRANARKIVKYSVVEFDGESVALNDKEIISFDIAVSLFTDGTEAIIDDLIESGDTQTIIDFTNTHNNAYNRAVFCYRHDEALKEGALVVGNQSYSAGANRVFHPTMQAVSFDAINDKLSEPNGDINVDYSNLLNIPQAFHDGNLDFAFGGGRSFDDTGLNVVKLYRKTWANNVKKFKFLVDDDIQEYATNDWTLKPDITGLDLGNNEGGMLDGLPITGYTGNFHDVLAGAYALFDSTTRIFKGMGYYRIPSSQIALTGTGARGSTNQTITLDSQLRDSKYQWKVNDLVVIIEGGVRINTGNIWHVCKITSISGGAHSSDQTIQVSVLDAPSTDNNIGAFTNSAGNMALLHRPGGFVPAVITDTESTVTTDKYLHLFNVPCLTGTTFAVIDSVTITNYKTLLFPADYLPTFLHVFSSNNNIYMLLASGYSFGAKQTVISPTSEFILHNNNLTNMVFVEIDENQGFQTGDQFGYKSDNMNAGGDHNPSGQISQMDIVAQSGIADGNGNEDNDYVMKAFIQLATVTNPRVNANLLFSLRELHF